MGLQQKPRTATLSSVYDAHPLHLQDATHIRLIEPIYGQNYSSDNIPELGTQSVSYRLHVFSLKDAPPFTALSYVWGPQEVTKTISLEGRPVEIRQNLWGFMSYYGSQGSHKYLWTDALSIDHMSVKERDQQVSIMDQVYRRAAMVIAWLGLGFEEELTKTPELLGVNIAELPPGNDLGVFGVDVPDTAALGDFNGCVSTIFKSDYRSRLWIVQECIISPHLRIASGMALLNVDSVLLRIHGIRADSELFWRSLSDQALRVIYTRDCDLHPRSMQRLETTSYSLISTFRHAKCADSRDRVRGLIALFNEDELRAHSITVDYAEPATELFFKIFERRRKQQILEPELEHRNCNDLVDFAEHLREALQLPYDFGVVDGVPSRYFHLDGNAQVRCLLDEIERHSEG